MSINIQSRIIHDPNTNTIEFKNIAEIDTKLDELSDKISKITHKNIMKLFNTIFSLLTFPEVLTLKNVDTINIILANGENAFNDIIKIAIKSIPKLSVTSITEQQQFEIEPRIKILIDQFQMKISNIKDYIEDQKIKFIKAYNEVRERILDNELFNLSRIIDDAKKQFD